MDISRGSEPRPILEWLPETAHFPPNLSYHPALQLSPPSSLLPFLAEHLGLIRSPPPPSLHRRSRLPPGCRQPPRISLRTSTTAKRWRTIFAGSIQRRLLSWRWNRILTMGAHHRLSIRIKKLGSSSMVKFRVFTTAGGSLFDILSLPYSLAHSSVLAAMQTQGYSDNFQRVYPNRESAETAWNAFKKDRVFPDYGKSPWVVYIGNKPGVATKM